MAYATLSSTSSRTRAQSRVGFYVAASSLLVLLYLAGSRQWLYSGAPLLSLCLVAGGHDRAFADVPLWIALVVLNFAYFVSATSWLLYWAFALAAYPAVLAVCVYQFTPVSRVLQHVMRRLLQELHFTADKIALFNLPALEIDRDVDGLMVIRGVTISLSTLTIEAHGVEVGIKLMDDMELALSVDVVVIKLFRRIDIGDVYGNVKGGEKEMNFYKLGAGAASDVAPEVKEDKDQPEAAHDVLNSDSRMLNAVRSSLDLPLGGEASTVDELTNNRAPEDLATPEEALDKTIPLNVDEDPAAKKYRDTLSHIEETSPIAQSKAAVKQRRLGKLSAEDLRAAVCAELHARPTVSHPPQHSIKVTTLQTLSPPYVRRFLHRLPFLLRLLLNVLSHFHPVFVESITAGGSGLWLETAIKHNIFKTDVAENGDIRNLQRRISTWLTDANFCMQLVDIKGLARVPVDVGFDIIASLKFNDILLYRTSAVHAILKEVVRLGGADATVNVPIFLLPHHEHLLPAKPSDHDEARKLAKANMAEGMPKTVQAERELQQTQRDQTNATVLAHVRLPACLDPELLEFVAALVKATKIVELSREVDGSPAREARSGSSGLRDLARDTRDRLKHGLEKATVDAVANDRWIARLVAKLTKRLETAEGDVGYSGDLPIALEPYRAQAEPASKLLP